MSRKHKHFQIVTKAGNVGMVKGDPNMSQKTRDALGAMLDAAAKQFGGAMNATQWNKQYPVGTPVIVRRDNGENMNTKTRSMAWELPSEAHVIQVEGIAGCYALDRVIPLAHAMGCTWNTPMPTELPNGAPNYLGCNCGYDAWRMEHDPSF